MNSVAAYVDYVTLTPARQSGLITFFRGPEELLTISTQSLVHTTTHKVTFSVHVEHTKMAQTHVSDLSELWVSSQRVKEFLTCS